MLKPFRVILRARSKSGHYGTYSDRTFPFVAVLPFDGPIQPGGKWDTRFPERFSCTQAPVLVPDELTASDAREYLHDEARA
jgi:hypothetical protein